MIRPLTALLSAGFALCAYADGDSDIIVETYADFVVVDRMDANRNLKLVVSGPNGYHVTRSHSADEATFIETRDSEGAPLADGVYTYEAWTEPAMLVTRSPDDPLAGRDAGLKTKALKAVGRTSGSFRVVNGTIIDPNNREPLAQPHGEEAR